jgi:hypothetical protein
VITARALNINKMDIDTKGSKILRVRKPGIAKVRLVTSKLVTDIVVLTPAKITPKISISCTPKPVKRKSEEKGVINVHPATVCVALEHFATYRFCLLSLEARLAKNQKRSGYTKRFSHKKSFIGKKVFEILTKPESVAGKFTAVSKFKFFGNLAKTSLFTKFKSLEASARRLVPFF